MQTGILAAYVFIGGRLLTFLTSSRHVVWARGTYAPQLPPTALPPMLVFRRSANTQNPCSGSATCSVHCKRDSGASLNINQKRLVLSFGSNPLQRGRTHQSAVPSPSLGPLLPCFAKADFQSVAHSFSSGPRSGWRNDGLARHRPRCRVVRSVVPGSRLLTASRQELCCGLAWQA